MKYDTEGCFPGDPGFIRPPYDVPFQIEIAKVIASQKHTYGKLLWICMPSINGPLYEPCFGIYVNQYIYNKLRQVTHASAIQLGFTRAACPAPLGERLLCSRFLMH